MSEYDDVPKERRKPSPAEASVHVARWSPWLWIIPAVAVFIAGWLVVRYGFFGGGDVTVRFSDARGLDRYSPVRFRGAKVGTVQKITIDQDLGQVVVSISMDASMNHALNKGTKFWIVEPGLGGGLGGILSGTYVGIAPGTGEQTRDFVGQEYAPVLSPPQAGRTVILEGPAAGSIAIGAPVQFHGMRVGTILGSEYDPQRGTATVHAFIVQRFADRVRQSTRWWHGGGLSFSLSGAGVSMGGGGGLQSLLNAPVEFNTPEILPGPPVADGTRFDLYDSQAAAEAAMDGPQLTYMTYFPGAVGGLQPGTPVQIRGVQVGRVRDVRLRYVPQNATLETPVVFEIDPRKLEIPITDMTPPQDVRGLMNGALAKLVQKGMRATLSTSLVLPGASGLSLEMVGTPGTARLVTTTDPPLVPAATGSNGLAGALAAVNDVAARIRSLPIEEIAGNLRSTAQRLNSIVHDPAIDASLQRLNTSLANVESITATAKQNAGPIIGNVRDASANAADAAKNVKAATENIAPIVASLRNAAASAESAAGRAQQLMGSSVKQNYDLGNLIKELTRAAESVRALATYLEENPDALLKGRGKAK